MTRLIIAQTGKTISIYYDRGRAVLRPSDTVAEFPANRIAVVEAVAEAVSRALNLPVIYGEEE